MTFTHWQHFIAAFLIVVGCLSMLVATVEWWKWRKETTAVSMKSAFRNWLHSIAYPPPRLVPTLMERGIHHIGRKWRYWEDRPAEPTRLQRAVRWVLG